MQADGLGQEGRHMKVLLKTRRHRQEEHAKPVAAGDLRAVAALTL